MLNDSTFDKIFVIFIKIFDQLGILSRKRLHVQNEGEFDSMVEFFSAHIVQLKLESVQDNNKDVRGLLEKLPLDKLGLFIALRAKVTVLGLQNLFRYEFFKTLI